RSGCSLETPEATPAPRSRRSAAFSPRVSSSTTSLAPGGRSLRLGRGSTSTRGGVRPRCQGPAVGREGGRRIGPTAEADGRGRRSTADGHGRREDGRRPTADGQRQTVNGRRFCDRSRLEVWLAAEAEIAEGGAARERLRTLQTDPSQIVCRE